MAIRKFRPKIQQTKIKIGKVPTNTSIQLNQLTVVRREAHI